MVAGDMRRRKENVEYLLVGIFLFCFFLLFLSFLFYWTDLTRESIKYVIVVDEIVPAKASASYLDFVILFYGLVMFFIILFILLLFRIKRVVRAVENYYYSW